MSGHSKWSTIKRKKAINDQQRSNIFTKMSRLITIAVHEGGGVTDPENNFKLRLAIDRAKDTNMPKGTIERAIEKASGGEGALIRGIMYEGFGPGNTSLLISATSDNTNRTHADVKQVLDKGGGKLAGKNSVAYLFTKCGVAVFDKATYDEQKVFEFADEMDALDIEDADDEYVVYIPFEAIGKAKGINLDVYYKPSNIVTLSNKDQKKLDLLVERLEDLDDVHNVYTNG